MISGRTIKIYIRGQNPTSLKQVELANWSGMAFMGDREHVQQARDRLELATPGLYFLLSDAPGQGDALTDFYVGETDDFASRIVDHVRTKDWWSRFVVFVSKDGNLTKAHVKYLERALYELASNNLTTLNILNEKEPGGTSLPESDISAMGEFLSNIQFVLEALGQPYFVAQSRGSATHQIDNGTGNSMVIVPSPISDNEFCIVLSTASGTTPVKQAILAVHEGIYVLKAGSYIAKNARRSFESKEGYHALWKRIISSDAVEACETDDFVRTTRQLEFRSPSAAAAVVRGRSSNGRVEWKRVSDGEPLAKCLIDISNKRAA